MASPHEWYYSVGASNPAPIPPAVRALQLQAIGINKMLDALEIQYRSAKGDASDARLTLQNAERLAKTKNPAVYKPLDPNTVKAAETTSARVTALKAQIDQLQTRLAKINQMATRISAANTKVADVKLSPRGLGMTTRVTRITPRIFP